MKKFAFPSAFVILFSIIIMLAIATWLIPAGAYEQISDEWGHLQPAPGSYHRVAANPQGIFDVILAPLRGFIDGIEVILFIFMMGGFLGIVMHTGAITKGVSYLIQKLHQREHWLIPILMIGFALGGSTFGMAEETLAFYPILLPAFLAAGYPPLVAVAVILLGAGVGVIGSTTNPFATGIASGFANTSIGDGFVLRILILIILLSGSIFFVMRYAAKHKQPVSTMTSQEEKQYEALHRKDIWVLLLFGIAFAIMIYAVIPFANLGIRFLPTLNWWFLELSGLFLVAGLFISKIFGLKEKQWLPAFLHGVADMLNVAFIIGLSRGITIIMNDGKITATILHYGETLLTGANTVLFLLLVLLFFLLLSFLIPSTSGLATLSMPIFAPLADFAGIAPALVVTVFQVSSGFVNLLTPASAVVMSALAFANLSYGDWLSFLWKFLLPVFLIIVILLLFQVYLPWTA